MSYSDDGVGKLKYDVCGKTKFNGGKWKQKSGMDPTTRAT